MSQAVKKPIAISLGQTIKNRIADASQLKGMALPCSVISTDGNFVTVRFEIVTDFTLPQVTIPIQRSKYLSLPIQPGDSGIAIPADALLGGVTGESSVTATMQMPSNLGALLFMPLGNLAFPLTNPLQVAIAGPNGVVLSDESGTNILTVSSAGMTMLSPTTISLACGAQSVIMTPARIDIVGALFVNGNPYPT